MWKSSVFVAVFAILFFVECSWSMPGGLQDIDIKEHESGKNALKHAVDIHNNGTDDMYLRDVSEVLSAQSQVVAGIRYIFKVNMARTNCTKDTMNEVCVIHQEPENAQAYECTFSVWSRSWLNSTIVDETCTCKNCA